MNIVKGVADLIRRTSSSQAGESSPSRQAERFSLPDIKIQFSDYGEEAIVAAFWEKFDKAVDKGEKRKLLYIFLRQFQVAFKDWEPDNGRQLSEPAFMAEQHTEYTSSPEVVVGCSQGHPTRVILVLIEEIMQVTGWITEINASLHSEGLSGASGSTNSRISELLLVLDALRVVTRSIHNCCVLGYYGGIQKLTALMKGTVIQLKTISGALSSDESLSTNAVETVGLLRQIFVYVVTVICGFIDLNAKRNEKAQFCGNIAQFSALNFPTNHLNNMNDSVTRMKLEWHQKAVMTVMESGGLNWLVELLRVIRRLAMKEQLADMLLQYLTLRTVLLILCDNPRGQNHFKSIGGLEVLLDGLGLPSIDVLFKMFPYNLEEGCSNPLLKVFQLHLLSLDVLKEAVFGNSNNLQFLCENGRVQKFANSFCSPAFMLYDYQQHVEDGLVADVMQLSFGALENKSCTKIDSKQSADVNADEKCAPFSKLWNDYARMLSKLLCSFLLYPENIKSQLSNSRIATPLSSLYCELSIKWVLRVLVAVFPSIKACSDQNHLPDCLRIFASTLQQFVLSAFKNVLVSSPMFLEVFRGEGIWNLIFSENFFYFGSASEESSDGSLLHIAIEAAKTGFEEEIPSHKTSSQIKPSAVAILQMEVISFVELAASLSGTMHNLPEISAILDAMEQSACSPDVANVLAKCLLNILRLSHEKTVASFMTLNAASRLLKVACVQARELRRFDGINPPVETNHGKEVLADETYQSGVSCMETCMKIFMEYFSSTDDARVSVLHSSDCIDCLFELFWENNLRDHVLEHIFELMKYIPLGEENQKAKLLVCSRYLEMFTQMKERERNFADLAVVLLVGIKDIVKNDPVYYQALFREGECFLHVVSLLNANLDEADGEHLVLNVLQTLTCLLASNDASKVAFRALTGKGYPTLHSLLLNFCQWQPSERLLNALLDMLVDGKFDIRSNPIIKNEDVIVLYLSVLQKSSDSLRCDGLNLFRQLVRDSISNRASCVRAEMLNFLLDWFPLEDDENVILKIAELVQVIGGHSISGKDIRKIFALLRSKKIGNRQRHSSLLLRCLLSMLNEKGPTAFFDMNGTDSGIVITSPFQWPVNKGFSFSCWLRVESFSKGGKMGIFSFLSNNGKGCFAVLSRDSISYVSSNLKRQCVNMDVNLVSKKWHFLCLTHSIGRAFSGGSLLKCYVDGDLVSSERCSYPKVNDLLASCSIGTRIMLAQNEDNEALEFMQNTVPFFGQIGPVYLFNDALSTEQIKAIHSLGPSYMFSFLGNETTAPFLDNPLRRGVLDGLASKVIFGLSAQASDGRKLFNVSRISEHSSDKSLFDARVLLGTQLCSRRLLQHIIYCVGGISVFFPLISQSDRFEIEDGTEEDNSVVHVAKERLTAEVIELVASVLDENLANQQQMRILSGFPVLGLLLQSVPLQQLNLETLSSLKHLFNVVSSSALTELLVEDAMSSVFLNPVIWLQAAYDVQRDLYMFVIQQVDNNPELLRNLCRLPRVIDMIRQFYWDVPNSHSLTGSSQAIGQRPGKEEIHKIRLLLLSLGEISLRQNITAADIKALAAFFETSQDVPCIEDVLHTVIRAVSQTSLLASFLEQVNTVGGCHIFINLLQSDYEPIRLLSLQFLGRLLVGLPSEKKGLRLFNLAVGRSKSVSESQKQFTSRTQPIFLAMSDRLFRFPQTDNLCATLFDVLLGGASPKQVLQKHNQLDRQKSKGSNSNFVLPQILILIFKFLSSCEDRNARMKIIGDLLDLLDSNLLNIEALMESGWSAWLSAAVKLDVIKDYKPEPTSQDGSAINEQHFVRNLFSTVLCHYILSVRGGWQLLEETVTFLSLQSEQIGISYQYLLRDIYEDLVQHLVDFSSEENMFASQPCRDNLMYLLQLLDEMLIDEMDNKFQFPGISSDLSLDLFELEGCKSYGVTLDEVSRGAFDEATSRNPVDLRKSETTKDGMISENWWSIYDKLLILICEMNGKRPAKSSTKSSASSPSLGQRARGLVESLNIPAAEMAAVVVSGGLGNAFSGKANKSTDKAMLLRGDKCPRIVFRLVILYLSRSSLERASKCAQQVISLLPSFLAADDEQSKNRLHLLIGSLLIVRSQYGALDDGARFHVISHLIRETISGGKSMLVTSALGRDESSISGSFNKEAGSIQNLIQKDRLLAAVADEASYIKSLKSDRTRQLSGLRDRMNEISSLEDTSKKAFEDVLGNTLNAILASDNSRRGAVQLSHDEQQQNVAEKWVHMLRFLMDERGPWSAIPFPNDIVKYWKLDKTEDSLRRRPKLRRNYHFDERLCLPPSACPEDETASVVNESKLGFVANVPEQMKRLLLKGVRRIADEGNSESCETESDISGQNILDVPPLSLPSNPIKGSGDQMDGMQEKEGSSPSPEMEDREVLISVPCVLITPKRKMAGRLAVMKNMLHFFGEFFVEGSGGSAVFKNFGNLKDGSSNKPDHKQQYVKWPSHIDLNHEKRIVFGSVESESFHHKDLIKVKRHRRWNMSKVKAVHWMRYLLQYTAIEVFFGNSIPPVFLNFASQKDAKEIGTVIVASRNELLFPKGSNRDKAGVISFVDRRAALEMAEIARESWKRRDITNFEYLMILNTLAGRSYNDLTQYPVFPWVLADYSSETLDFNKASTFRDLSKPVGALDPKRLEVFEDRYHNFSDPDIPSFYYGSHYSSMGIVLYYLLRLEPFTSLHRSLQGGKFDHADRLFQSIEGTFRNCLSNTSDVKELIPEFFYMPEFLVNSNYYHLGVKQDGDPLGDVSLPPWAKGSPELFISRNREALESEYVSSHLHNWIDLIFGYKQRGKPAVEAANIFYYLTYEGAVDLNNMEDELQKSAIEDQIANFGQTPIQIFRKKHPRRGPPNPIAHPLYFAPASINLTSVVPTAIPLALAIQYVSLVDSNIVIVNQGLTLSVKLWLTTHLQSGGNFTFSGSQDPFFGVGFDVLSPRNIGSPLAENVELGSQCFTTIQTSSENFLISCGNWENSFQVISLTDGQTVQSIRHHKDVVSCVAVTHDWGILATGSYDTTVMVWDVVRVRSPEKRTRNTHSDALRKDYIIAETPFHILCGHDDIITCLYVSVELDIVISGSKDGTCVFHTLREGRYIRSLKLPSGNAVSKLVASRHGRIVLYAEDDLSLHLYSINGKHLASSESNGRLNCLELSGCGGFLVCAGDQGQIVVRSMNSLEAVRRYNGIGKMITSLTVTPEECFLAGTKDGNLLVYSIENPQVRKQVH